MNEQERQQLTKELSDICLTYHPNKGPHQVEQVTQRFDYYQIDQAKQIEQQRAGTLEYIGSKDPQLTEWRQSSEDVNGYFDNKQKEVEQTIKRAYIATCKANNFPLPNSEKERERSGDGGQRTQKQSVAQRDPENKIGVTGGQGAQTMRDRWRKRAQEARTGREQSEQDPKKKRGFEPGM